MRRTDKFMNHQDALDLIARSTYAFVATGEIVRALHVVLTGGDLYFHSGKVGEKRAQIDERATITFTETLATIPSYWSDPVRACPATTYYRSVMAHGTLREVLDLDEKRRALEALMDRHQPEGGFSALPVRGVRVVKLADAEISGKIGLGQKNKPELRAKIARGLWTRGGALDLETLDAMTCAFDGLEIFGLPRGLRARTQVDEGALAQVVELLRDTYWHHESSPEEIAAAHRASAWIGIFAGDELLASARALSDGRFSWIADVVVARAHRGRGLGQRVMELLLDHPRVRTCRMCELRTRDAAAFYARFGFATATGGFPLLRKVFRDPSGVTS